MFLINGFLRHISRRRPLPIVLGILLLCAITARAPGQVLVRAAPGGVFYSGAAGFEAHLAAEWYPGFLVGALAPLSVSLLSGIGVVPRDGGETVGIPAALGVAYTIGRQPAAWYARAEMDAGVQYSVFSEEGADNAIPVLLLPSGELGYRWESGLEFGLQVGLKTLLYTRSGGNERSLFVGLRAGYPVIR